MSLPTNRQDGDVIENEDINALASAINDHENRLTSVESESGGSGSGTGVISVSGTVILDRADGDVQQFFTSAAATINGIEFDPGTVVVFRREPLYGEWSYIVVYDWIPIVAPPVDDAAPIGATLAVTGESTQSIRTLTVTGAQDLGSGLDALPYSFSWNGGAAWTDWQASNTLSTTLTTGNYQPRARVRDASGNIATIAAADFTMAAIPTGPVSSALRASGYSANEGTSSTVTAVPIGNSAPWRLVLVSFRTYRDPTPRTLIGVTIGGITATIVPNSNNYLSHAYAVVPSGTTADIAVSWNGAVDGGFEYDVFTIENTLKSMHSYTAPAGTKTPTVPAAPAGSLVFAIAHYGNAAVTFTWPAGYTEILDRPYQHPAAIGSISAAWGIHPDGATHTITVAQSNNLTPTVGIMVFEKAV